VGFSLEKKKRLLRGDLLARRCLGGVSVRLNWAGQKKKTKTTKPPQGQAFSAAEIREDTEGKKR